jgi:hypothetical protein
LNSNLKLEHGFIVRAESRAKVSAFDWVQAQVGTRLKKLKVESRTSSPEFSTFHFSLFTAFYSRTDEPQFTGASVGFRAVEIEITVVK